MSRSGRLAALLFASACVIGVRGTAVFESSHDLAGVSEVRVELPSTPMQVRGCDPEVPATCPDALELVGAWASTGATKDDARANASEPVLVFERLEGFAELRAEIPQDVLGLVELELDTVGLPADRDLSIATSVGDIEVIGMSASVTVDVQAGDVRIVGGNQGVGVRTEHGNVSIETSGNATATVGDGSVEVVQLAGPRDLVVEVQAGNIVAELADTANVRLHIEASGDIVVRTDDIVQVTEHELIRETGVGTTEVTLRTRFGGVTVRQR